MEELNDSWKKSKLAAGAVMLLKGYAPPLTICGRCHRSLAQGDGVVAVRFRDKSAFYDCPHCRHPNEQPLKTPQENPYG